MKKTLKKVLCTTLAAFALVTGVTASSTSSAQPDFKLVSSIEANAASKYADFDFYLDIDDKGDYRKVNFFFKITEDSGLWGRETPDGSKKHKFKKGEEILIDQLRYEKYSKDENRIWARTYSKWDCNDKKQRKVWICVARGIKSGKDPYYYTKIQARCTDKNFCGHINLNISENAKLLDILNEYSGGGHGFYCRKRKALGDTYYFVESK